MKKNIYLIFSVMLLGSIFSSCKKGLKDFDGASGIYFLRAVVRPTVTSPLLDTTAVSFGFAAPTTKDSTLLLPIMISGPIANVDRSYKLSFDPSSTAVLNQHFQILNPQLVIRANQVIDTLKVKLLRTPDMLTQTYSLVLKLESNDNFKTTIRDQYDPTTGKQINLINHRITFSDLLVKPKAWLDAYLGPFSRKKLYLMGEVLELKDLSVLDDRKQTNPGKLIYYGSFMQRYLNEMELNGKTVLDEDKSKMVMGSAVQ